MKKKIMIIDDEENFLEITKMNLEKTGNYEVATYANAKDIISHIHSFKPNVILLDLLMPGIGGVEVCQMLNDDAFASNIPIIVVSALDKDTDKLKAYKAGVVDYITKPTGVKELVNKIETAIRHKEGG
ncbi:MAG: response regulator [Candidatus Omnitrophota bacterium]|nr:MAG: response regulator [Candidatus Omnitrophota bacterium]